MYIFNTSTLPNYQVITKKNIVGKQMFHSYVKFIKLDNGEILDLDKLHEHAELFNDINGVKVDLYHNITSLTAFGPYFNQELENIPDF